MTPIFGPASQAAQYPSTMASGRADIGAIGSGAILDVTSYTDVVHTGAIDVIDIVSGGRGHGGPYNAYNVCNVCNVRSSCTEAQSPALRTSHRTSHRAS